MARNDLVQVGETVHGIGEGLFVDLGVFRLDAVAQNPVCDGGEFENLCKLLIDDCIRYF